MSATESTMRDFAKGLYKEMVKERYPGYEAVFYSDLSDEDRARWNAPDDDAVFIRPEGRWPWEGGPSRYRSDAQVVAGHFTAGDTDDRSLIALELEGALMATDEPFQRCYGDRP